MVVEASVFNVPKNYVMTVMMVDMHLMVVTQAKFKDSSNTLLRPRDLLLYFLSSSMEWDDECSCKVSAFQWKLSADAEEELSNLLLNWLTSVEILRKAEMLKWGFKVRRAAKSLSYRLLWHNVSFISICIQC